MLHKKFAPGPQNPQRRILAAYVKDVDKNTLAMSDFLRIFVAYLPKKQGHVYQNNNIRFGSAVGNFCYPRLHRFVHLAVARIMEHG